MTGNFLQILTGASLSTSGYVCSLFGTYFLWTFTMSLLMEEGVNRFYMAQDKEQWRAFMNRVIKLQGP
jgi:hypothetical protein